MTHTFHRENCVNRLRKTFNYLDSTFMLIGRHAFEWEIVIGNKKTKTVSIYKYTNRKLAQEVFENYKKQYRYYGNL